MKNRGMASPSAGLVSLLKLGPTSCRYPIGEPGQPDFRFCGKPRVGGRSYCPEHVRITYGKPARREWERESEPSR
jgi:GcrA cell cycle regulator